MAERNNRDLVSFFLSFTSNDGDSSLSRKRLGACLTLFSKFSNPKALHATETLHKLYVSLLSHSDGTLQSLALSCLLTYKSPHLLPHQEQLRNLLDDARWRDELVCLEFDKFEDKDRSQVVDVIIRLLFGVMLRKNGRSRGGDRRSAVLTSLASCTDTELACLVDLMLKLRIGSPQDDESVLRNARDAMSWRQQVGYLHLLGDVLRNLGTRLVAHWPSLLGTAVKFVGRAQQRIDAVKHADNTVEDDSVDIEDIPEDVVNDDKAAMKMARLVRQLGIKRFAEFFRCAVSFDFTPYVEEAFKTFISPRLPALDKENTQAPSALLELFFRDDVRGDEDFANAHA